MLCVCACSWSTVSAVCVRLVSVKCCVCALVVGQQSVLCVCACGWPAVSAQLVCSKCAVGCGWSAASAVCVRLCVRA